MSGDGTPGGADTGAPAAPWYDGAGLQAEEVGYFQNRGWDKLDAKSAAVAAARAHREAEKLIGAPANEILRMPKDANDAEGWKRVNDRLGVPAEAKDYDFSSVKKADGSDIDATLADKLRPVLQAARVSKDTAPTVLKAIVDTLGEGDKTAADAAAMKLAAERDALKTDWNQNLEQNMLVVKQTAKTLNIDPEAIGALEKVVGYSKVMQMMLKVGQAMGEDKFIMAQNNGGQGSGYVSKEQAQATLDQKMNDKVWTDKLTAGDVSALREFDTLTRVIGS